MTGHRLSTVIVTALFVVALCLGTFLLWRLYDRQAVLQQEQQVGSNTQLKLLAANQALGEAQAELESLRAEIAQARADLNDQFDLIDQMYDEHTAAEADYTTQIETLTRALKRAKAESGGESAASGAPSVFVGVQCPLRFELPQDLRALEVGQMVYLAGEVDGVTGILRVFADINGMPLQPESAALDELFAQMMDQMGVDAAQRPTAAQVTLPSGEALRFTMEYAYGDGSGGFSEIALLKGAQGYYCLEIEGLEKRKRSMTQYLDKILATMTLEE